MTRVECSLPHQGLMRYARFGTMRRSGIAFAILAVAAVYACSEGGGVAPNGRENLVASGSVVSTLWKATDAGLVYLGASTANVEVSKSSTAFSTAQTTAQAITLTPDRVEALRSVLQPTWRQWTLRDLPRA